MNDFSGNLKLAVPNKGALSEGAVSLLLFMCSNEGNALTVLSIVSLSIPKPSANAWVSLKRRVSNSCTAINGIKRCVGFKRSYFWQITAFAAVFIVAAIFSGVEFDNISFVPGHSFIP